MWSHRSRSSAVSGADGASGSVRPAARRACSSSFGLLRVDAGQPEGQPLLGGDLLDQRRDPVDPDVGAARARRPDDDRDAGRRPLHQHQPEVGGDRLGRHLGHRPAEVGRPGVGRSAVDGDGVGAQRDATVEGRRGEAGAEHAGRDEDLCVAHRLAQMTMLSP